MAREALTTKETIMPNITLYTKTDLKPLLKRLRSALKLDGATLSAWFDRCVREAVESNKNP